MSAAIVRAFSFQVPPRVVTNDDLSAFMETSDEWITQRTGIKTRHWVDAPTTTSDLAVESAKRSLERSGTQAIDCIVAATLSPDYFFPGIGVLIQDKLGLSPIPALDVRNQCSGFLYSLEVARALVLAGQYQKILVVGAEVHSTGLDISTRGRDIAVLFGDGAGSCIVERADCSIEHRDSRFEILAMELGADGAFAKDLWCEHPGSAHFPTRITPDLVTEGKIFPLMNGKKVFEHAVRKMTEISSALLKKAGLSIEDVKLFLPHQANLRINQMVGEQLGLRSEQVFNTLSYYGNTTAASIPIGFARAEEEKKFSRDDIILSAAFGSGFTWGGALLKVM